MPDHLNITIQDTDILVHEGATQIVFGVKFESGAALRLVVDKRGNVRLDHSLMTSAGVQDERTILTGSLSKKKRTFDVYSSSGYVNHYKGKPIGTATTAEVKAAIAEVIKAGKKVTGKRTKATKPLTETLSGTRVRMGSGQEGVFVGTGEDMAGVFIEVEWDDDGYQSMYQRDWEAADVHVMVDDNEKPEEPVKEVTLTLTGEAMRKAYGDPTAWVAEQMAKANPS